MTDKYAHLRPHRPRECHRADHVPKRRYTQEQAEAVAAEPGHEGTHAYRCGTCGSWHVGHHKASKGSEPTTNRGDTA